MSQPIHARTSYQGDEILFGYRFADNSGYTETGRLAIDYAKFHDVMPADATPNPGQPADRPGLDGSA